MRKGQGRERRKGSGQGEGMTGKRGERGYGGEREAGKR